jgi:hypothetical protein
MTDRAFLERLSKELADQGKLIEAGWVAYRVMVLPPNAPAIQIDECRLAYMAGAQYLFFSILTILDPGEDPTDADLNKMDLINKELQTFAKDLEQKIEKGTSP